jgi:hypothetical protein
MSTFSRLPPPAFRGSRLVGADWERLTLEVRLSSGDCLALPAYRLYDLQQRARRRLDRAAYRCSYQRSKRARAALRFWSECYTAIARLIATPDLYEESVPHAPD